MFFIALDKYQQIGKNPTIINWYIQPNEVKKISNLSSDLS